MDNENMNFNNSNTPDPYNNQEPSQDFNPNQDFNSNQNFNPNPDFNQNPGMNQNQGEYYYSSNPYSSNTQPNTPDQFSYTYESEADEKKGLAIAGLVLGILSIVFCCCCGGVFAIIGLILSIVALVKGEGGKGFAIGGLVTSIIGLIFGIIMIIAMATTGTDEFMDAFKSSFSQQYYEETGEEFDWDAYN